MSPPASSTNGEKGVKRAKPEESTPTSDRNGGSHAGDGSMKVQDFMSLLAKEANITNMTVETKDGRRISASFKDGLPATPDNKHVSVTYSKVAAGQSSLLANGSGSNGTSSLPPKKRAKAGEGSAEASWNAMSALVDAATVAQREHEKVVPGNIGASLMKKTTKRKPRKIIPEIKEYVEFTQKDVLFGRGGRSNHHPGNKIYREIVTNQQAHYRGCDKNEKTRVAQGIVDKIQKDIGGRFLELDRDVKRWFLVPNVVARRKVGQALRENNTEEARAAKRAKYQGRLNSKKKTSENGNGVSDASGNGTNSNIKIQVGATAEGAASAFKIEDVEGSKVEV